MLTVLARHELNVVLYSGTITESVVADLIDAVRAGEAGPHFDAVLDFRRSDALALSPQAMIRLAMSRRATLEDAPGRLVRNAVIGASDAIWETLETWNALFADEERALEMRRFDTAQAALDWIGKPEALDEVRAALGSPRSQP